MLLRCFKRHSEIVESAVVPLLQEACAGLSHNGLCMAGLRAASSASFGRVANVRSERFGLLAVSWSEGQRVSNGLVCRWVLMVEPNM